MPTPIGIFSQEKRGYEWIRINGCGPVWLFPFEGMSAEEYQVQFSELEQMMKVLSDELQKITV